MRTALELRAILVAQFPECFSGKRQSKRPLKLGIHKDIAELTELTTKEIKRALADYVRGPTYLRNLVADADRIGLGGEPFGAVSQDQAKFAAVLLGKMKRRHPHCEAAEQVSA